MIRLSANLGFLWTDVPLIAAVYAAKKAGFDAVECHWPYDTPPADLYQALDNTGLPMIGLNTLRGDTANGENGIAAIAGREVQARSFIDQSIDYASAINCPNIHVMAGKTDQQSTSEAVFQENLRYACRQAQKKNKTILIEPLNYRDAPGYHLATIDAALATIKAVAESNLKIMFDCYHIQIMQGDLLRRLENCLGHIGHIQIASVPDRSEPGAGEIDYVWLLDKIDALGWQGYIGAEYRPSSETDKTLGWMAPYRQ